MVVWRCSVSAATRSSWTCCFADPRTGRSRVALTDTQSTWVDLHDDLHFLSDGRFIWSSEQSGWRHLYLYDRQGKRLHAITRGDWPVQGLAGVGCQEPAPSCSRP